MKIFGLAGKKRAGKDTVFSIARDLVDGQAGRVAFADPLKREVAAATGMPETFVEANKSQFRPVLQWWGTEFRRQYFGADYWINQMAEEIRVMRRVVDVLFITDVRFPNEGDWVRDMGGTMVRVERDVAGTRDGHSTEVDMDSYRHYDHTLDNHGTVQELAMGVGEMLRKFLSASAETENTITTTEKEN